LLSVNLDIKNPHSLEALEKRSPKELIAEMLEKERRVIGIMEEIRASVTERQYGN
jgi:type I restriction enzyme M protein